MVMKAINKKSKGITTTDAAIFVAVIGILTMTIVFLIDSSLLGARVQVFRDSSHIYSLIMLSGSIKNFLKYSSQYSLEQSTYEVLKSGGLLEDSSSIAIWLNDQVDSSPTIEKLRDSISVRYKEILLQYLNQLTNKQSLITEQPSIKTVKINLSSSNGIYPPSTPTVNLTALINPIKIGTSSTQYLLVNSSLYQEFNFLIEDVFDKGKELLEYGDDLATIMKETNYCMSDDEIKNHICTSVGEITGETNLIGWSFACDKNKIEITKESTDVGRTLELEVYTLVAIEDKKSNIFVYDDDSSKWSKLTLQYYIINDEATSVDCCPGDTKACVDEYGCSGNKICGNDYEWGACTNVCIPDQTSGACSKPDSSLGTLTCVKTDSTCQYECK